ncbi:MAG: NUDIX hydrolase [Magnetococcales bacterium]|nr:NUDIX hydrolase [Magnetococcales bacterium]
MEEKKPDYWYLQSAVVPYRMVDDTPEIMMITSRKKKRWVVPKGIIEPDLPAPESAAKEAWEEAGIKGDLLDGTLGSYKYQKWAGTCTVDVFVMRVTEEADKWLEDFRDRQWVSVDEAVKRIKEPALKEMVGRVNAFIHQYS